MSDNFSLTTKYGVCEDVKMMYAPPKLDPPFCGKSGILSPTTECGVC